MVFGYKLVALQELVAVNGYFITHQPNSNHVRVNLVLEDPQNRLWISFVTIQIF